MEANENTSLYDEEQLKLAQKAGLRLLLEIDRLSESYGFNYFLDSGTLIGAVRHRGFIPWDDDVDIAMKRADFERFLSVKDELNEGFELVMPDGYADGKAFYDFTPRIIYMGSRRHEEDEESAYYGGKLNHLWMDIFILDELPDNALSAFVIRFLQKFVYGLAMSRRYRIDYESYGFMEKLEVKLLQALGKLFALDRIFSMQERISERYNGRGMRAYYYSNYQPDYLYVSVERSLVESIERMGFEGHELSVPSGYDRILDTVYGDYMKLPPKEKQVPSHHSEKIEVFE